MNTDSADSNSELSSLCGQLGTLRDRHSNVRGQLARIELSVTEEIEALSHLRDDLQRQTSDMEHAGGEHDRELDSELDAAAQEITDFAHHLTARSHSLHEELDAICAEAHCIETEVSERRRNQHERVTLVTTQTLEAHQALETHRATVTGATDTAAHAFGDSSDHATTRHHAVEQQLADLHQGAAQAGHDAAGAAGAMTARGHSATDELREQLGVVGGLIATAVERLQRSAEQTVQHEIDGLIHEAVQAIERLFDDLVARLGHSHQELASARSLIEPLLHELEGLIPNLSHGASNAQSHVEEVQRRRDEEEHHDSC